jgi:hypothetical protein
MRAAHERYRTYGQPAATVEEASTPRTGDHIIK